MFIISVFCALWVLNKKIYCGQLRILSSCDQASLYTVTLYSMMHLQSIPTIFEPIPKLIYINVILRASISSEFDPFHAKVFQLQVSAYSFLGYLTYYSSLLSNYRADVISVPRSIEKIRDTIGRSKEMKSRLTTEAASMFKYRSLLRK